MTLRTFSVWLIAVFLGLFAGSGCAAPSALARPLKPNIIFILADDLGYSDLGCYGQRRIRTPNLDRLAAGGTRFTQVYAGCTVCAPSRAVLMTGRHTGHAWIRGNSPEQTALRPEDVTVAELLRAADYRTTALGKWGLGDAGSTGVPTRKGFQEWLGYLTHGQAHNYYPEELSRNDGVVVFDLNAGGRQGMYTHDLFTRAALNTIRINSPDVADPNRRFFLYLAYTIPHANNELGKKSGNGMEVPSDEPYSREDWPQPEKNKAAMITRLDADIGKLLEALQKQKVEDKTVIFFTSDNGPHKEGGVDPKFFASAGPLRGIKRDLYEGGIRVPMIVHWPGRVAAGATNDFPWAFWDVLPTLAELGGVEPPKDLDGQSVLPVLLGRKDVKPHEFFYWEFHEKGFQQAVRMGDWKAVRPVYGRPLELYNLREDPAEARNVAQDNPDVVAKIERYLKTARTESARWTIQAAEGKAKAKAKAAAKSD